MKKILIFLLLLSSSQSQILNDLHTPDNIRKFADYLFSEKDYLRSVSEYKKLNGNDTIQFKIAVAYQEMQLYETALYEFYNVKKKSVFFNESQLEYFKTLFLMEDYKNVQDILADKEGIDFQKLLYLSYLFTSDNLPAPNDFINVFPSSEKDNLLIFFNHKKEPPYKSPLISGLMSAVIPGSGKIYLGKIGDGITAFIASSLLAFLSYDNFSHNHDFRGWLFAGLGAFFYAGNVYGSVSAANIYNAKVDYEYKANLKEYLNSKNYFLPENDFIK